MDGQETRFADLQPNEHTHHLITQNTTNPRGSFVDSSETDRHSSCPLVAEILHAFEASFLGITARTILTVKAYVGVNTKHTAHESDHGRPLDYKSRAIIWFEKLAATACSLPSTIYGFRNTHCRQQSDMTTMNSVIGRGVVSSLFDQGYVTQTGARKS